ncbi:MAG: tryptophan synthase subunit alpha [Acidobacteria bacterium]|nr:tryptophan synthase subunit alpha [Acidobacteriota bacterium]
MTRIQSKFHELKQAGRKAFIPYLTAGDPDLATTAKLILSLAENGADIIELGVPFSDPMADGLVIQRASERALRHQVSVRDCLDLVKQVRLHSQVPIVLFSYLNPLLSLKALGQALREVGVDGVLATDLVPEEAGDYLAEMREANVDTIFLVAPTSPDARLKRVADCCTGFIYAVSRTGVTGVRQSLSQSANHLVHRVRRFTELPIAVGFGISTPEQVAAVWQHADAAVVGSRIVAEIENLEGHEHLVERIGALTRSLVGKP